DEPAATQPGMYAHIRKHPTTRQLFEDKLVADGGLDEAKVKALADEFRSGVEAGRGTAKAKMSAVGSEFTADWSRYNTGDWTDEVDTSVSLETARALNTRPTTVPAGFPLHPRVERIVDDRRKIGEGTQPMDWGFAETMAYATLLRDGHPIRLTGQDSGRGTFFHRHAVLHNQENAQTHVPLQHLDTGKADFVVTDSLLSEEA